MSRHINRQVLGTAGVAAIAAALGSVPVTGVAAIAATLPAVTPAVSDYV
jgi:hypothetical protein